MQKLLGRIEKGKGMEKHKIDYFWVNFTLSSSGDWGINSVSDNHYCPNLLEPKYINIISIRHVHVHKYRIM